MQIEIFDNEIVLAQNAANLMVDFLCKIPDACFILASGYSTGLTYDIFVKRLINQNINYQNAIFCTLDEWIGIEPTNHGSCAYFLQKYIAEPLQLESTHTFCFDSDAESKTVNLEKAKSILLNKTGKICTVLGLGLNGHIGFNEPFCDFEALVHMVNLDTKTIEVGQKYFKESTVLRQGITFGLGIISLSTQNIMLVNGAHKSEIVHLVLSSKKQDSLPATVLIDTKNTNWLMDKVAAELYLQHN